jgi:hypothetical protein
MHNSSRCSEIEKRFPGLIAAIVNAHNIQLEGGIRTGKSEKRKLNKKSARTKRAP